MPYLDAVSGERLEPLYILAVTAGLRKGEQAAGSFLSLPHSSIFTSYSFIRLRQAFSTPSISLRLSFRNLGTSPLIFEIK
jgi:hypothetical protein